jgi:hypothetical protein
MIRNLVVKHYFFLIENKVEKMDYLIDGILTYAKIDKCYREKVNVDEIVRNIINIIDVPYNSVVSIKINCLLYWEIVLECNNYFKIL